MDGSVLVVMNFLIFPTAILLPVEEIPAGGRIRILMLSNNKDEAHKPVRSCRNHEMPRMIGKAATEHARTPLVNSIIRGKPAREMFHYIHT